MCCKGFLTRIIPFLLTFAVGLFIAGFFVSVTAPSFQFNRGGWKGTHRQYHIRIESENQRLRDENMRLRNQMAEEAARSYKVHPAFDGELAVPPPPPLPPAPKSVPYRNR